MLLLSSGKKWINMYCYSVQESNPVEICMNNEGTRLRILNVMLSTDELKSTKKV
jgi:hypothetical protein